MEISREMIVELVARVFSSSKGELISVFCASESVADDASAIVQMAAAAAFPATRVRPGGPPSFVDGDGVGGVGMSGDSCDAEDVEVCETDRFSSRSCLSLVFAGNSRFNADILFMLALVA